MSSAARVNTGVPQGSILSPLLYILFTSELPEVPHHVGCKREVVESVQPAVQHQNDKHAIWTPGQLTPVDWTPDFTMSCEEGCGELTCYADDSTFTCRGKEVRELSWQLSLSYTAIANYLTAWRLKVNDDKTHVMLLTTSQNRKRNNLKMSVMTGETDQETSEVEKLLGMYVHEDLKFKEHLLTNTDAVIKNVRTKINAMRMLQNTATKEQLMSLYHGLVGSRLAYLCTVWGGAETSILAALQRLQNMALRIVCRKGRDYPVKLLLSQTKTLSVQHMITFHTLVQTRKVIEKREPVYLYNRLAGMERDTDRPNTRHAGLGNSQEIGRICLVDSGFVRRADRLWRELPRYIVNKQTLMSFKKSVRIWILRNI